MKNKKINHNRPNISNLKDILSKYVDASQLDEAVENVAHICEETASNQYDRGFYNGYDQGYHNGKADLAAMF